MRLPFLSSVIRLAPRRGRRAFSLIELMVATIVLLIIMGVLLQMVGSIGTMWKTSSGKVSAYRNARSAFATISATLGRATLNTYNDYVDKNGLYRIANPITPADVTAAKNFTPANFARTSELHMISGRAAEIIPGADAVRNPGHAIFFQAPLGDTASESFVTLSRAVNSVGFYVQYGVIDDGKVVPTWLQSLVAAKRRFRLIEVVEPTESLKVYTQTALSAYTDTIAWLDAFKLPIVAPPPNVDPQPRARVLAEDVTLLVIRPRLSPELEQQATAADGLLKSGAAYAAETQGSILCPNYNFDSRAWQTGYPAALRVTAASVPAQRVALMRNQTPPIIDVAMIAVDPQTLARFDTTTDTPPAPLLVPAGLFTDSSKMEEDLKAYGAQLSAAHIRYRLFRSAVEIKGAKWSNN